MRTPRGQTLLLAVITVATIAALGVMAVGAAVSAHTTLRGVRERALARAIAEAGLEQALYSINNNALYAGETNTAFGGGAFTVAVSALDITSKQITATGYWPSVANPRVQRTLRIRGSISTTAIAFNYGVQAGAGGVFLTPGTTVAGNLYANGNVCGTNGPAACTGNQNGTINGELFVSTGATLDQQHTLQNQDQLVGKKNDANSVVAAAQSFIPGATDNVTQVALYLKKNSNPQDITLRIQNDSSGSPGTTVLGSGTLIASLVTTTYGWVNVPLSTPASVTSGTTYWITLDAGGTDNKYWFWGKDSNQGYGNGIGKGSTAWNGGTWNTLPNGGDLNFKLWLGGAATKIDSVATIGGHAHAHSILNTSITGDAYYQTISGSTVAGTSYQGYCLPGPPQLTECPIQPFPVSDGNIADWEDSAAADGTPLIGNQTLSGTVSIGPKKILGDLTIGNSAVVTLTGPLWVVGNVNFTGNNAIVKLDATQGATSSVIIADDPANPTTKGQVIISNGSDIQGSGATGSYIMALTKYSGPGTAIDVGNNVTGAILYASTGLVDISNGVAVKEVTAYQLRLKNGASITYESGLANANFTTGPGAVWTLADGTWQELTP